MASLQEIRQKYPQYNDMSDQEFADKFHAKYYSDIPKDQFYEKMGLQTGGTRQQSAPQKQDFLTKAVQSPGVQALLHYGTAAQQPIFNLGNIVNKKLGLGEAQPAGTEALRPGGTAVNIGQTLGDIQGFLMLGGPVGMLGKAAETAPLIGKGAQWLGKTSLGRLTGGTAGGAAYGALMNPEDRTGGAMSGAAAGAIPTGIMGIPSLYKGVKGFLSPKVHMENLLDTLSKGKSATENAQSLANDLQNAYKTKMSQSESLYAPVEQAAGKRRIPRGVYYYQNPDEYLPYYDFDLKKLHNTFISKPNFKNAQDLYSQLGKETRKLEIKPGKDLAETKRMQIYKQQKENVLMDINSFLNSRNPDIADRYLLANQFHAENIGPYHSNPKIERLISGDEIAEKAKVTPKNISDIFRKPITPVGAEEDYVQSIDKILGNMPADTANRILSARLSKVSNLTPKKLVDLLEPIKNEGFESYITPDIESSINMIEKKMGRKKAAKWTLGTILAGAALPATFHEAKSLLTGGGL